MFRMIFIQSCALFPSMFFSFDVIFRSTYDDTSFGSRLSGLPMPTHILVNGTLLLRSAVCILLTPLWPLRERSISPCFLQFTKVTPCVNVPCATPPVPHLHSSKPTLQLIMHHDQMSPPLSRLPLHPPSFERFRDCRTRNIHEAAALPKRPVIFILTLLHLSNERKDESAS